MNSPSWKSERGTSLVEVLIAMVVLIVGVFTIIRIFPMGFDVLQFTGNASVAQRLAQAETEFWRKNAEHLPDGIVAIMPAANGTGIVVDPTARPNDFILGTNAYGDPDALVAPPQQLRTRIATQLGAGATDDEIDRWVGPNRMRRIIGETTRIPLPSPVMWGPDRSASIYSLAFAPIDIGNTGRLNDPNAVAPFIQVRGNALSGVDITNLPSASLNAAVGQLAPNQYAIDDAHGMIYFPRANHPRRYLLTYSYNTPTGPKTALDDSLLVPTTPANSPLPGTVETLGAFNPMSRFYDSSATSVVSGSEQVSPRFRFLLPDEPFTSDPYEFKFVATTGLTAEFTGAIAFNPLGYDLTDTGPGGSRIPLQAKIDYTVTDWRVLHQEVTLPDSPPYRVALDLPYVKQAGISTEEGSLAPWPGLAFAQGRAYSVVAVDIANGNMILNNIQPTNGGLDVDYRTGTLYFPNKGSVVAFTPAGARQGENPAGRTFRVFYEVEGDWAVVPQKAYSSYQVIDYNRVLRGAADPRSIPIGTAVVYPTIMGGRTSQQVMVLFPTTDEGKSVSYNYSYRTDTGQLKTVYNQEQQITSEARQTGLTNWYFKVSPTDPLESPKPYIEINLPSDASIGNTLGNDFILGQVQGSSFRAVTLWRDRSRWRDEAVDAYLTRTSQ